MAELDDNYISLLKEYSDLYKSKSDLPRLEKVKWQLTKIERLMSSADIIKNTKTAFPKVEHMSPTK